ncbi:MAG: alpha/beta fold hydrolase [Thermoleophilaceae bacterium]
MLAPLRTLTELAEPIARMDPGRLPLRALLGQGRTSLSDPRPAAPRGHVEYVPGAGDLFYRDTARRGKGERGTVLLLHGWMVPSDPHWLRTWSVLEQAGWRVVALDARGHGRGLRTREPFRLTECSEDAAALVRHLDCGPVSVVGYSMGGTIAQLLCRDHPDLVRSAVLCATGCEFQTSVLMRTVWSGMGIWQLYLRLAPQWTWETAVRAIAHGDRETTAWAVGELRRGAAWDIAEAGREIGRFDSRAWVGSLETPMAVVLTTVDVLVPPARQRELARRIGVTPLELRSDHLAPATTPRRFHACLLEALDRLESQGGLRAVADSVSG